MERFSLVLWDVSHSLELPLSPTSFVSPFKSVNLSSWTSVSTSMFLHLHPLNVFVSQPLSVPSPPLLLQSSPTSKPISAFVFQPLPALSTCRRPTAANHQLQTGSDIWKMIICCQWRILLHLAGFLFSTSSCFCLNTVPPWTFLPTS